jgi:predicted small lipoprotein YifL
MLRDFVAAVRPARRARIVPALAVSAVIGAAAGCGIKGPLRPAAPPAPTTAPAPLDVAPVAPATEANPTTPRKP